jgi:hypothetical protein
MPGTEPMIWISIYPRRRPEHLGTVPSFLDPKHSRSAAEQWRRSGTPPARSCYVLSRRWHSDRERCRERARYLNQIGLPDNAIVYVTSAPPEGIEWLTPQTETPKVGYSDL